MVQDVLLALMHAQPIQETLPLAPHLMKTQITNVLKPQTFAQ